MSDMSCVKAGGLQWGGGGAHLANKLHVTILDTVVHHLDVVARTFVTNPLAARLAIGLGRNALKNILDVWPCLLITTWHDRRAVSGTLLTTRDTGSDEADALGLEVLGSAVGVWEMRVTTINNDITLLDTTLEQDLDEVVDRLAGHDEKHHTAWLLQLRHELADAVCAHNALALGFVLEEAIDLGDGTVECDDGESVIGGIEDEVLTHDRKADETEVSAANTSLASAMIRMPYLWTMGHGCVASSSAATAAAAVCLAGGKKQGAVSNVPGHEIF